MMEDRDLLSSILHLRFFLTQGAPDALGRERRSANTHADGALDCVRYIRRHRVERCFA
ncbi:MAG: hypothetical protein HW373_227, partial [Deltaproteobacteria bacterium]|nr:hypothetical protein [Deltaproteobacteria bacterium]